jgi:hypothetical protein
VPRLATIHPVALARAYLLTLSEVTSRLPGEHDGIGVRNEPPYPCIVLTDVPGNDRAGRHLIAPMLQIEVLGDLDGTPSRTDLRGLYYDVLDALVDLPAWQASAERNESAAFGSVVTEVVPTGGGGWVPLPTRQPRYLGTVQMFMHPTPAT